MLIIIKKLKKSFYEIVLLTGNDDEISNYNHELINMMPMTMSNVSNNNNKYFL